MRKVISLLLFLALVGGGVGYWYWQAHAGNGVTFKTVAVTRGPLVATISSTGTLEPINVIDVGAQVSGMIEEFGRDPRDPAKPVDYLTEVTEGDVLALLDPSLYKAAVDKAQANLELAQANQVQNQALYKQADRDWERAQNLKTNRGSISDADYDQAEANYYKAKAQLKVGEASIKQAKADLETAETNLRYCTIKFRYKNANGQNDKGGMAKAKAKGVIIDRRVNIGQTVVASLNAPSLFLIATDLSKMQVWASVNEADIGQIKPGQLVQFTVDAHPGKVFEGRVNKTRLNATMTQNVVTYTVEVDVDNARYSNILKPYMTTNLQFVINEKKSVLRVPNAALRWRPQLEQVVPSYRDKYAQSLRRRKAGDGAESQPSKPANDRNDRGFVWVADGEYVRRVNVKIGLTDGTVTEIVSGLKENDEVVVGVERENGNEGTSNPFAPKIFGGKKQQ
jgi:HlyD family secretion protein